MGALPGDGLLRPGRSPRSNPEHWFDVEPLRRATHRRLAIRRPDRRVVVLGSTQPEATVDAERAAESGVTVLRRRGGGGAVLLEPGNPLWVDVWVPREDPLWDDDVVRSAGWVGHWWATTLAALGVPEPAVHEGASVCREWSGTVCFAGLGPGEVTVGGRKVVGLAQWRSRQGALLQIAAYLRWEPGRLIDLLAVDEDERSGMRRDLATAAVGLEALLTRPAGAPDLAAGVLEELHRHLPRGGEWGDWEDWEEPA